MTEQLSDPVDAALARVDAAHKAYHMAARQASPYIARRDAAMREWEDAWAEYDRVRAQDRKAGT